MKLCLMPKYLQLLNLNKWPDHLNIVNQFIDTKTSSHEKYSQ